MPHDISTCAVLASPSPISAELPPQRRATDTLKVVPRRTAICGICLLGLVLPAAAQAEIRDGSVTDPQDQAQSVDGRNRVDLAGMYVRYDTTGTLSITAQFFDAYENTSGIGGGDLAVRISDAGYYSSGKPVCTGSGPIGGVFLYASIYPSSYASSGSVSISGYDGSIAAPRSRSADGKELTWTVTHPLLADRNYICVTSASLSTADQYGHCSPSLNNCQRIVYSYIYDTTDEFFFRGFEPTDCSDGLDNDIDGKTDEADPGCLGGRNGRSEDGPQPVPTALKLGTQQSSAKSCSFKTTLDVVSKRSTSLLFNGTPLFPLGKARVRAIGRSGAARGAKIEKRLDLSKTSKTSIQVKRAGRYEVQGTYLGDKFRKQSVTVTKSLVACKKG